MGLDITAYRNIFAMNNAPVSDEAREWHYFCPSKAVYEWVEKEWPGRTAGFGPVNDGDIYGWSEQYDFRAGSYSNYGDFRDFLARLGGWASAEDCWADPTKSGPFYELINFADNEGYIGPEIAKKLLQDFRDYNPKACAEDDRHEAGWYYDRFQCWRLSLPRTTASLLSTNLPAKGESPWLR
jgi:hypothetical protein